MFFIFIRNHMKRLTDEQSISSSAHQLTLPSSVTAISNATTYNIINIWNTLLKQWHCAHAKHRISFAIHLQILFIKYYKISTQTSVKVCVWMIGIIFFVKCITVKVFCSGNESREWFWMEGMCCIASASNITSPPLLLDVFHYAISINVSL